MRRVCFRLLIILFALACLGSAPRAAEVDRLVSLARVWAAVKYLHPLMLQKDIDWDGALVRAIPKVRAAESDDAFAAAVGAMLGELGDPATRVVRRTTAPAPAAEVPLINRQDDLLVISAGPYANAKGLMALYAEQARLPGEIAKARHVIIDVRNHAEDPDEVAFAASILSSIGGLSSAPLTAPSSRVVLHSGYRPQTGTTSGGYYSAFLTLPGAAVSPAAAGAAPSRVVFVTDAQSVLPAIALALRNADKAWIVSDSPIDDGAVASLRSIPLPGNWRARIRVEDISTPVAADAVASDPMAEALAIVQGKKTIAPARRTPAAASPEPLMKPDADYKDMVYPGVEHRLLAAFRIWSVIDYFYPYKPLIGDWDEAFADAIPRFVGATDADAYAQAVLQLVARVEDGHSVASGHPSLPRILGTARPAMEVREIEGEIVVTRLPQPLPPETDLRVGDVVVSVDGEAIRARMGRLREYVTASTEAARTSRLAGAALQGQAGSPATLVVRGGDKRDRTVRVARATGPRPPVAGEPYRVLEGNIGYVNLMRLEVPEVDAMFEALKAATAIIFDMRGYPRGTAWSIAPRLNTKRAAVAATFRRVQVTGADPADGASPRIYFEQRLPASDKPLYRGKTVMLIDERAISQAEHTALFFEAANGTTFIGTPTAGANGDVTNFSVPGGFRISFSGHDVRHADDRQLQRVGIQPHVRVAPTIAGIRAGRDEVLERAIAFVSKGK